MQFISRKVAVLLYFKILISTQSNSTANFTSLANGTKNDATMTIKCISGNEKMIGLNANYSTHNCSHANQTQSNATGNDASSTDKSTNHMDFRRKIIQVTLYGIVFIFGVTGNLLVLLTVTSKRLRSVRHLLIGNLAISDLITLLVSLPLVIVGFFVSWPFGEFICKYFYPLADVVISVSIMTISVIAMDRFRAIVYPFATKMTLKKTMTVIAMIWVLSYLVVAVPLVHLMKITGRKGSIRVCRPVWPSDVYKRTYRLALFVILYVIPVCLVFFCFICIAKKIKCNLQFMKESVRGSQNLARIQRTSRVVRMMFVIFITFTICLLPIHLILIILVFYPPSYNWPYILTIYNVSLVILIANSCMNPVILYFLSSQIKRGIKEHCLCSIIFMKAKKKRRKSNYSSKSEKKQENGCLTQHSLHDSTVGQRYTLFNSNANHHQFHQIEKLEAETIL